MAVLLAAGTLVQFVSAYAASVNMTAITNASEAVATLAAGHGVVVNDYLESTSGWERLNNRIVRVKTVSTNDVTLESINTTSTSLYPAGSGTGTVRRIQAANFTTITQITREFSVSGGDQNFGDATTLANILEVQIPTTRSPLSITLPFYMDPSLSWLSTVRGFSDAATANGFRFVYPSGARLIMNAYASLRETPTVDDSTLRGEISLALLSQPVLYAT